MRGPVAAGRRVVPWHVRIDDAVTGAILGFASKNAIFTG
jgi:hypothetical protein